MMGRLGHAALALGLAQLIGCAQGYDSGLDDEPPTAGGFSAGIGSASTGAGRGGATSQAGSRAMAGGGAGMTTYMGDPCERGETEECMCPGTQGKGVRTCRKDDLSPTMGTFSNCESCVPDPDSEPAGMGASGGGASGSGSAGRGGSGGSAGRAGSSSGSAGTSGRTGGSSGSSGGSNDPAWCFFVPVPLPGICD